MITIITGKPGSGKTTNAVTQMIKADKQSIMLIPDQMSIQMETFITTKAHNKVTSNIGVYTFKLLEKQILKSTGNQIFNELNITMQYILINEVYAACQGNMLVFKNVETNEIFFRDILQLFKIWRIENIDYEYLMEEVRSASTLAGKKLKDICVLYKYFINSKPENSYFPEEVYKIALENLRNSIIFDSVDLYVDGFNDFSESESLLLIELAKQVQNLQINISVDADNKYSKTIKQLIERISEVSEVNTIDLQHTKRFPSESNLDLIANSFPNIRKSQVKGDESIEINCVNNFEAEIHLIAQQIKLYINENKCSYSEIAIYLPEISSYKNRIKSVFKKYKIPAFIDEKETIEYSKLARIIYALNTILTRGRTKENIFSLLRTGIIFPEDIVARLHKQTKLLTLERDSDWNFEKIEMYCSSKFCDEGNKEELTQLFKLVHDIQTVKKNISHKRIFGEKLEIYIALLEKFKIFETLFFDSEQARAANDLENAQKLKEILKQFNQEIERVFQLFNAAKVNNSAFYKTLELIVENIQIVTYPSSIDQVNIGDFDRSRFNLSSNYAEGLFGIKYVFMPNFINGKIPTRKASSSVFNNEDIENVIKTNSNLLQLETMISDSNAQVFQIYLQMLSAQTKAIFSYSLLSKSNEAQTIAPLLNFIARQLAIDVRLADPFQHPLFLTDRIVKMFPIIFQRNEGENDAFITTNEMDVALGKEDFNNYSISQIELYNQCSMKYFFERRLMVQTPIISTYDSRIFGNLSHKVLETIAKMPKSQFDKLGDVGVQKYISDIVENYVQKEYGFNIMNQSSYLQTIYEVSQQQIFQNVIDFSQKRERSKFIISNLEHRFDIFENSAKITGKIDRIDVMDDRLIQVIDYKSSDKKFDFDAFSAGIQVQLPFYLYALKRDENFQKLGIFGVFYQSLKLDNSKEFPKLSGLITSDVSLVVESSSEPEKIYDVKINQDGNFKKGTKCYDNIMMDNIINLSAKNVFDSISKIKNKQFKVNPHAFSVENSIEEPKICEFCQFQGACNRELITKKNYRLTEKKGMAHIDEVYKSTK